MVQDDKIVLNLDDMTVGGAKTANQDVQPTNEKEGEKLSGPQTAGSEKTEWQKMLAGELYLPMDPELTARRYRARLLLQKFNNYSLPDPLSNETLNQLWGPSDNIDHLQIDRLQKNDMRLLNRANNEHAIEDRLRYMKALFGKCGRNLYIEPPFQCDYGTNIELGDNCYFNFGVIILDVCKVTIGDRFMAAPYVQIYSASHPLDAETRASGREDGQKVTIGDDVWIGGGAIIRPGVTIGNRSVIAAGAVVVKNVPDDVLVGGNPAKILRSLVPDDPAENSKTSETIREAL